MAVLTILLALACTPGDTQETEDTQDTEDTEVVEDTDVNDVDWDGLYGEVPSEALPAPEFAATNRDGSARSKEDLLGHPTVVWFYPMAATSG